LKGVFNPDASMLFKSLHDTRTATQNTALNIDTSTTTQPTAPNIDTGITIPPDTGTAIVIMLEETPIVWKSQSQRTVSLSSTEAEYHATSEAAKKLNLQFKY
jgi:hypothetical protein